MEEMAFSTSGTKRGAESGDHPSASSHVGKRGVFVEHPTGTRAEPHVEPECALHSATDPRGNRGHESASTSGAYTITNEGTDGGLLRARVHRENRGNDSLAKTSGAAITFHGAD